MRVRDDLGEELDLAVPPARVVSLVPSLTESLAATGTLVGATNWCTWPPDLDVVRARGTKNPDVPASLALRPDLVVVNKEENRQVDVCRLRASGARVWVTVIETVPEAVTSLERLFTEALGRPVPQWLGRARELWLGDVPPVVGTVAVPIWRDPWMVVGRSTFTGDLLRRVGLGNVFADSEERYPHVPVEEIDGAGADLVLLPDEPYVFAADDGPQAFRRALTHLISGRLLTWYGPSLVQAHEVLTGIAAEVGAARPS